VLPVVIENANGKYFSELPARPTRAGATFPVTQVAGDERASSAKWNDLPPVSSVNSVRQAKPGATVLLTGVDNRKQDQIVLAYQRYGAARRSRCRSRTRGCGGWTPRSRSPTRRTRCSGGA
jgi:hypothetical protein